MSLIVVQSLIWEVKVAYNILPLKRRKGMGYNEMYTLYLGTLVGKPSI